ncbi:3'-5' exonuclease [Hydrogenobaculum acidophilum]
MYFNESFENDIYVVLDIETTGLNPDEHEIIEIFAFLVEKERITKQFHRLVNPGFFIPKRITEITGITNAMLVGQPKVKEVIYDFDNFVKDYIIVGHNVKFDLSFLNKAYSIYLQKKLNSPNICTLELSKKLIPNLKSYKLSAVADYFNIKYDRLHRAKDDALLTYNIFNKLIDIARKQYKKELSYFYLKSLINSKI